MNSMFKYERGLPRPAEEPASCDEMRQAILKAYRDDSLIHAAMQTADYRGMSGEDRYTVLAYHALRELNELHRRTMSFVNVLPAASIQAALNTTPSSAAVPPESSPAYNSP